VCIDFSAQKQSLFADASKASIRSGSKESLVPIGTWIFLERPDMLVKLWKWRCENAAFFFYDEKPSLESYSKYLREGPIESHNRLLFLLIKENIVLGHMGINLNCEGWATVDNVLRGISMSDLSSKGAMLRGVLAMIEWTKKNHKIYNFKLEVRSDNLKAIEFYERCGFSILSLTHPRKEGIQTSQQGNPNSDLQRVVMVLRTTN
jgi:hypothetical protein